MDVLELTLQNFYDSPDTSYRLTGGTVLTASDGPEITIQLSKTDLDAVKTDRLLCVSKSTCFVMLSAAFLTDIAGNTLNPTTSANANLNAQRFTFDVTAPRLVSFGLDMEARTLTLRFDEPVSSVSLRATALTVMGASSSKRTVLAGGSTVSPDGSVIVVDLLTTDINEIKRKDYGLALNDTFLAITSGDISDMAIAPNPVAAVTVASPMAATSYTPDSTQPRLLAFALDLNAGQITLDFSEPIRAATSLRVPKFALQSTSSSSAVSVTLVTGTLAAGAVDGVSRFALILSTQDMEAIKVRTQLATTLSNTYLTMEDMAITDMTGNAAEVISASSALMASSIVEDVSPTVLQAFTLNMDNATLLLTFSDVVLSSTLKVQGITVQDAAQARTSHTLMSSRTSSPNGLHVLVELSREDLLELNSLPQLAKSRANTFITISAITIDDIYGRNMFATVDGRGLQASVFVADSTPPAITRFSFNLGSEELSIDFSEAVVPGSLNMTCLVCYRAAQPRLCRHRRCDPSQAARALPLLATTSQFALVSRAVISRPSSSRRHSPRT